MAVVRKITRILAFAMISLGCAGCGALDHYQLGPGQFDIRDGKGQGAPIDKDLDTFPVRVEGDDILVEIP